jgi:hypothetical protein
MADIHQGLKSEVLGTTAGGGVDFTLARITHGREDVAAGVHARPVSHFISGGIDRDEFLRSFGFHHSACHFTRDSDSYCVEVANAFDLEAFAAAFGAAFESVRAADTNLQKCGFYIEARDFPAKQWVSTRSDGHTGSAQERLKQSEDAHFKFVFSWVEQSDGGGWTTHYRAKEQPLSLELAAALQFLGLRAFDECIDFDFEPCLWRRIRRVSDESAIDSNNHVVHGWFDSNASNFSTGLERLLEAEGLILPFGFSFLPGVPSSPIIPTPRRQPAAPQAATRATATEFDQFDVAISFAGPQRELAEQLATILRDRGVAVFYDRFFGAQLWGKHLPEYFDRIFRTQARYCLMFVSPAYRDGVWTTHERRSALARAVADKGQEYILPVMVEAADLDGIPPTVGYLPLDQFSMEQIADMLIEKLGPPTAGQ